MSSKVLHVIQVGTSIYISTEKRNLVVIHNKKEKKFRSSLLIENDSQPFQETCKTYSSNKGNQVVLQRL